MLDDKLDGEQQDVKTFGDKAGQQLHVSGVFIVVLELALVIENTLPIVVVLKWLPVCARGVGDRLIVAFSLTCILSALIPTPLGLASYFSGTWFGGSPTCTTYQVTSIWCNLSSLALLAYICVNCRFAVKRLVNIRLLPQTKRRNHVSCYGNDDDDNQNHVTSMPRLDIDMTPFPITSDNDNLDSQINNNDNIINNSCLSSNDTISCPHRSSSSNHRHHPEFCEQSSTLNPAERHSLNSQPYDALNSDGGAINSKEKHAQLSSPMSIKNYSQDSRQLEDIPEHSEEILDHESSLLSHSNNFTDASDLDQTEHSLLEQKSALISDKNQIDKRNNTVLSSIQPSQNPDQYDSPKSSQHYHHCTRCNCIKDKLINNTVEYEDSTFIYYSQTFQSNQESNPDLKLSSSHNSKFQARDYISLVLFFLYSTTLAISTLPVVGFGPQHRIDEKMCNSWLVPTPSGNKERIFFIVFLLFVYMCLLLGCFSWAQVCVLVNRRMKEEAKRSTRLYHQEEDVPDIRQFSILDDLKRHYSLACIVMAGILTWAPIVLMLTLQKAGLDISEATLVYSNIATSLPGLLNPLLYSLALARYRHGYKAIFERCCKKKGRYHQHALESVGDKFENNENGCEVTITSSTDGHETIHCRPNPVYTQPQHEGIHNTNGIFYDDHDDDDDDDEDCFYETADDQIANQISFTTPKPKLSEKTPLQLHASLPASTNQNRFSNDVKENNNIRVNPRHWPNLASQSNHWDDEECLLAPQNTSSPDDDYDYETGL